MREGRQDNYEAGTGSVGLSELLYIHPLIRIGK